MRLPSGSHHVRWIARSLIGRERGSPAFTGRSVIARPPGSEKDRDLSLLDWSLVRDLSPDGKLLLFDETGEGGGARHALYMRSTDGSPAVQLGSGWAAGEPSV